MATTSKRSTGKRSAPARRRAPRADQAGATAVADDAPPTDGRAARAVRTRTVIVDALLSLLEEGDLQPPANRIAERAGISLRLIYHHFGDLESLFRAAASREAERLASMAVPIDPDASLEERISGIVIERTTMLEWISPVRRAALLQEPFSEELVAARDAFYLLGEDQITRVFARELEPVASAERAAMVSALHGALAWGYWNDLRISGRSAEQATAAVRLTVESLLSAAT